MGKLIIAGGNLNDNNTEIYETFFTLSNFSKDSFRIGIISAASDTPSETAKSYANMFESNYNITDIIWIPITTDNLEIAFDQRNIELIYLMTGLFFTGGDQTRLNKCLKQSNNSDTPMLYVIREQFKNNKLVIMGTSASTAIQQKTPMITGGESYEALLYGSFPEINSSYPKNLSYDINGGFGFFEHGYLDVHFGARGRQGRIIRLIHDQLNLTSCPYGFGIDENTALVVIDNIARIIGYNGVYFFNLTKAISDEQFYFSISNVYVSYLTQDDIINLEEYSVVVAPWKKNMKNIVKNIQLPPENYYIFSSIMNSDSKERLNSEEFTKVSLNLIEDNKINQTYGFTFQDEPRFRVLFSKTNETNGLIGEVGSKFFITYLDMIIIILPDKFMKF